MKLRKPCEHGRYEQHTFSGRQDGFRYYDCPGGEFLADDALVIARSRVEWALIAVGDTDSKYQTCQTFLDTLTWKGTE